MTINAKLIADLIDVARDAVQDDFPTTRHLGAGRLDTLLTNEVVAAFNFPNRRPQTVLDHLARLYA